MIYTITLNPSVDYYIYLDDLKKGLINRISKYQFIAAGKGINASRMLSKSNIKSICIFPKGGFSGDFLLDELKNDTNIECRTVSINQPNRINVKIRHDMETDLNLEGPTLDETAQKQLLKLVSDVKTNDTVVISGSIQRGLFPLVKQISDFVNEQKGKLVLDIPNLSLRQIIECHPFMIKPNLEELQFMLCKNNELSDLLQDIKSRIIQQGVKSLFISLESKGAYYIDENVQYSISPPKVKVVNTVAAGDSLLAETVGSLQLGKSLKESLKLGVAAGTAAVMVEYLPEVEDIQRIYEKVNIEEIQ